MKGLLIALIFFCLNAMAHDFVSYCKKQGPAWHNSVIASKDCSDLREKLLNIKSLSEFYRANKKAALRRKILHSPWTDEFPYLYGLHRRITPERELVVDKHIGDEYSIKVLSEFKNIVDFSYLPEFKYYSGELGVCRMLRLFPNTRTLTIESKLLENAIADNCISNSKVEGVVIRDSFKGFKNDFIPKSKIIGIEAFEGELSALRNFKSLRFLGVSNSANVFNGIESLYLASRLTHLSINYNSTIVDVEKIKLFRNLEFLTIICTHQEKIHSPEVGGCQNVPLLQDVSFIKSLRNLKHLNLSHNKLTDISPVLHLSDIRFLKLRGNLISNSFSISKLQSLEYLDLSGNELRDLEELGTSSALEFLNISGNKISNLEFTSKLSKLKYLNASFNPLDELLSKNQISYSLKFLNLDSLVSKEEVNAKSYLVMDYYKLDNQQYIYECMFHNFIKSTQGFIVGSYVQTLDFSSFPNLNVLSLKGAGLQEFPISQYLNRIQYFDLRWNKLFKLPDLSESRNLIHLDISGNDIVQLDLETLPQSFRIREMVSIGVESNRKYQQ